MSTITPTDVPAMAGIVLAGGLSSRMGQDKALLRWQGRSLLAHMCALLQAAGAQTLRVSGSYPALPGVESVPDLVPRCGPLGGALQCGEDAAGRPCLGGGGGHAAARPATSLAVA